MSKLLNDGGPAFPFSFDRDKASTTYLGMSLRDWFAGQALAEMLRLTENHDGGWDAKSVAAGCYHLADAMIAAREET